MDMPAPSPLIHSADIFCPHCGYNLRGTDAVRCPECGKEHKPEELATNRIPWTYRRSIGRVRAFIRTVRIASFRPRLLALSFDSGIAWRDGRFFRWLCILPIVVALTAILLANGGWEMVSLAPGYWLGPRSGPWGNIGTWPIQLGVPWYIGMRHWPIVVLAIVATAHALSMLPVRLLSFARLPDDRRGAVLGAAQYINGAALGGALLGTALALVTYLLAMLDKRPPANQVIIFAAAMPPVVALILWARACYRFYQQAALSTGTRLPPFWLLFPALFLLTVGVWLIVFPSCIGLFVMIYQTLTG